MADDDTNDDVRDDDDAQDDAADDKDTTDDDADDDDSGDDDDGDSKDSKKDPELVKAIRARDRAKREARRLRAELDKGKKDDDDKPDPEQVANTKIVRTAAHGILRGLGVEDKEDRIAVLNVLRLDDIDVDADGADEDAIEERIEELRSILGARKQTNGRVPRTVKTKRETKDTASDPDAARYRRIIGR